MTEIDTPIFLTKRMIILVRQIFIFMTLLLTKIKKLPQVYIQHQLGEAQIVLFIIVRNLPGAI